MPSFTTQLPSLKQASQARHPLISRSLSRYFTTRAPASSAADKVQSSNVSVLPRRRGLPANPSTVTATCDYLATLARNALEPFSRDTSAPQIGHVTVSPTLASASNWISWRHTGHWTPSVSYTHLTLPTNR